MSLKKHDIQTQNIPKTIFEICLPFSSQQLEHIMGHCNENFYYFTTVTDLFSLNVCDMLTDLVTSNHGIFNITSGI